MIDSHKLREFLAQKDESSRVEFKLKYDFKGQQKSKNYDEFVKDIVALTNTAGRAADDYAYLIIGAGDTLRDDGTRKTEDVLNYNFTVEQFYDLVNARCYPPIREMNFEKIEYAGNHYGIVEIPPSSAIHHLKKDLNTPGSVYHEGSVLIRRGPMIKVATPDEIRVMEREKESWSGISLRLTAAEQLEEWLPDPNKKIVVRKFIIAEAKKLRSELNDPEFLRKDSNDTYEALMPRITDYDNITKDLRDLFAIGCFHGENMPASIWSEALTIIGDIPDTRHGADRLLRLRCYPVLSLFYTAGVAAVAAKNYRIVAALFNQTKVRRWNMIDLPVEHLMPATIIDHYDEERLKLLRNHRMPLELHLQKLVKSTLNDLIHSNDEFLDSFTRFEYFFAMKRLEKANLSGVIQGSYMWESEIHRKFQQSYLHGTLPVINDAEVEISRDGADWLPFKNGVFSGDWNDFKLFKNGADQEIYQAARRSISGG